MATERIPTDRIIQALRETNGLVSLAAKRVPCSITTINVRRKRVQAVEQVIQECRGELVDLGELALRKAVLAGEPWAVSLVLKTLGKDRGYVERQEVTGAEGKAIEHRDVGERREYGPEFIAGVMAELVRAGVIHREDAGAGDAQPVDPDAADDEAGGVSGAE